MQYPCFFTLGSQAQHSYIMNSKEIGMFKVLFLCLGRFCQSIFFPIWLKSLKVTREITKF